MAEICSGPGMRFHDPGFPWAGRQVLRSLFYLSTGLRESLLFRSLPGSSLLQRAVQRSLGGPTKVSTEFTEGPLRGKKLECLSSEKYFLMGSSFERETQRELAMLVSSNEVAYDIGANVGYITLLLSVLCPNGQVFSFEPSPLNFQRLERHVELNHCNNISLQNRAVSDHDGTVALAERGSMSQIVPSGGPSQLPTVEVRAITLDNFVYRDGNPAPTFVKIDVEGSAGQCLEGMRRILRESKPDLIVELHDDAETRRVQTALAEWSYKLDAGGNERDFPVRRTAIAG